MKENIKSQNQIKDVSNKYIFIHIYIFFILAKNYSKNNNYNYTPINKDNKSRISSQNDYFRTSRKSLDYKPYDTKGTQGKDKKYKNDYDTIQHLKNKITMLENKTNRLQSMNEVFLDLLKNQQKINKQHSNHNPNFINQFENRYENLHTRPLHPYDYGRPPRLRKTNSQLDMFNIKDIKYYKEPIKLIQEQLKAYIFQTTLDRRRQEYLMNEQINDIKSEVHNRLLKLENQQRLNFESISNSINTGSYYNNFETLGQRLMINQKERENLEDFMDEKFRNLKNIIIIIILIQWI